MKAVFDFDFYQKYTKVEYFTMYSFFVGLGGYKAFFEPVFAFLFTFITLAFFYRLAVMFLVDYSKESMNKMEAYLEKVQSTLSEIIP